MQKVNFNTLPEESYTSPKGKFSAAFRQISGALGREPKSTDLLKRHPFDVEWSRIPVGKVFCPYHSHSAQWEFYIVLSGHGVVRDEEGEHPVEAGDCFLFKPGEAHQLRCDGPEDMVYLTIADNPIGESWFYPDSGKWGVSSPKGAYLRSEPLDYFDGEE